MAKHRAWRSRFGRAAERHTEQLLTRAGLRVIERRFRRAGGEIDLIALDNDGELVFVEVKARCSDRYGAPLEAVDLHKQRRLGRVAGAFLRQYDGPYRSARFDVVSLQADGRGSLVSDWVRDAFRI
ncbi:MAG TPA: YraN family protein [Acidobacteriota bacterium]|nr:YraN family protein [Acidobacteriota bacterium]